MTKHYDAARAYLVVNGLRGADTNTGSQMPAHQVEQLRQAIDSEKAQRVRRGVSPLQRNY